MLNKRSSGVLLHISSLPGKTGIGTLGKAACDFVDYLKDSGQSFWQILPVCPTSYGDSPYQSFSTFAGNPYFIDFDLLEKDGLLKKADWESVNWGDCATSVDYGRLYVERHKIFSLIQHNFEKNIPADFEGFCEQNAFWLDDYALFMAIKDAHGGAAFGTWEEDIRLRKPDAMDAWHKKCAQRSRYYKILQYLFFKQWFAFKKYANDNGIRIIGDIPIYVAADSSDVWSSPEQFVLDENSTPVEVAGCPPDGFSADGQLWGNPVYDWQRMKSSGYAWWKKRLEKSLEIYDVIRIDHFRGFDSYYCIPYGAKNAQKGIWRKGPGMDLFRSLKEAFGELPLIAEDLGFLTDSVKQLLADSGFPGMKVLQFAFDSREESDYIPYRYTQNCVVYTGTHDNDTILGWAKTASPADVESAKEFLRVRQSSFAPAENYELVQEMMITAEASVANTCILTMQDLIGLGGDARMNTPATVGSNWKWRATAEQLFSPSAKEFLIRYTKLYGRMAKPVAGTVSETTKEKEA